MSVTAPSQVLEVRNVTKRFGNHAALDDVTFSVGPREVVALLGDNGAGKSTLVKAIAGLHRPDDGTILLRGQQLTNDNAGDIGFVFQDLALFDNLTVTENLFAGVEPCWPRRLGGWGVVRKKAMLREARSTLDRLEVRIPNIKSPVGLLSGGQRQAIAVCKGMAFAKDLVVLDEPTAALGLRERRNVLRLVQQLPEAGISVVLISHNLEEVISVADRAVVLRQGIKVGEVAASHDNHEQIVSLIVGGQPTDAGNNSERN